jgi:hypothetical protein
VPTRPTTEGSLAEIMAAAHVKKPGSVLRIQFSKNDLPVQ